MAETLSPPRSPSWDEPGYSNLSHEWAEGFEPTDLVERGAVAPHAAWGHWGIIWWEAGAFHEQVWQWNAPVEVLSAESLRDLIEAVNDKYGYE